LATAESLYGLKKLGGHVLATYTIDLNAMYVPPDRRVWRMFPGRTYGFIDVFLRDGVAFLDLPGLELPEGRIDANTSDLKERILRADAIRAWLEAYRRHQGLARESGAPPPRPDQELSAYTRRPRHRSSTMNWALCSLFSVSRNAGTWWSYLVT
jgi:hypothetical protein